MYLIIAPLFLLFMSHTYAASFMVNQVAEIGEYIIHSLPEDAVAESSFDYNESSKMFEFRNVVFKDNDQTAHRYNLRYDDEIIHNFDDLRKDMNADFAFVDMTLSHPDLIHGSVKGLRRVAVVNGVTFSGLEFDEIYNGETGEIYISKIRAKLPQCRGEESRGDNEVFKTKYLIPAQPISTGTRELARVNFEE